MIRSVDETARLVGERPGTSAAGPNEPVVAPTGGVRRVLRFDWPGGPSVVAKLYDDDSGAATFAAQRALAAQVGPGSPHLAIPDALLYDAASRILLQELAGGDDLSVRVAAGDIDRLVFAGRAVAHLHSLTPPAAGGTSFADLIAILMRPHPRIVAQARQALGPRIEALLAALEEAVRTAGTFRATVHRDLHFRQMMTDGQRIWIVDFDLTGAGDPALDIGNLAVWTETHLAADVAARCQDRFLSGYADVAGDAAFARTGIYRAFTFLRLACKRFRLGQDFDTQVLPMIHSAEEALGEAIPGGPLSARRRRGQPRVRGTIMR